MVCFSLLQLLLVSVNAICCPVSMYANCMLSSEARDTEERLATGAGHDAAQDKAGGAAVTRSKTSGGLTRAAARATVNEARSLYICQTPALHVCTC